MMMKAIIDVYKREQETIEDELDIQIISPMRRGEAGSTLISQYVQQAVNPPDSYKGEARVNGITYRVGDKVIQILNDYELEVLMVKLVLLRLLHGLIFVFDLFIKRFAYQSMKLI